MTVAKHYQIIVSDLDIILTNPRMFNFNAELSIISACLIIAKGQWVNVSPGIIGMKIKVSIEEKLNNQNCHDTYCKAQRQL